MILNLKIMSEPNDSTLKPPSAMLPPIRNLSISQSAARLNIPEHSKRNKKLQAEIAELDRLSVRFGAQLERVKAEVEVLQGCLDKLVERPADSSNQRDEQHNDKKTRLNLEIQKREAERITKEVNNIQSLNVRKRTQILSLRKERTLYDQIFKNLETQILVEERRLLELIEKGDESQRQLEEAEEALQSVLELVRKSKTDDFRTLLRDEEKRYQSHLKSAHLNEIVTSSGNNSSNPTPENSPGKNPRNTTFHFTREAAAIPDSPIIEVVKDERSFRVSAIESFLAELRIEAGESDLEELVEFYKNGEQILEDLYSELTQLQQTRAELETPCSSQSKTTLSSDKELGSVEVEPVEVAVPTDKTPKELKEEQDLATFAQLRVNSSGNRRSCRFCVGI